VKIQFTKMNGAGNDFVIVDNRDAHVLFAPEQITQLCHRHRGIGADGLILLRKNDGEADWAWEFYNANGSDAEMCGNGARCFARYIQLKTGSGSEVSFQTVCGIIRARIDGKSVTINLTDPQGLEMNEMISTNVGDQSVHSLNTGVPHAVLIVDTADQAMVGNLGSEIRHHDHFAPSGTNVNFVQILAPSHIHVRTFERGVGETLACGTGVAASGMITAYLNDWPSLVKVDVLGGDTLSVAFERVGEKFSNVLLTGPADFVYEGTVEV
jgi:diaminopimelate epimerase